LRAAGIGEDRSLFLSYVRRESDNLARALWQRLIERGFEVFLDCFSLSSGRLFADQLTERLARAETLVLLESASVPRSTWVRREIALARSIGTSVLVLSPRGIPPCLRVDARDRHVLAAASWRSPSRPTVERAASFVDARSAMGALRARVFSEQGLRSAARREGLSVSAIGPDVFTVQNVAFAPRGHPASLRDLRSVRACAAQATDPAVVVGEHHLLSGEPLRDLEWAASSGKVILRRRRDLATSMRDIKRTGTP
jgi:hypothetical protein